MEAGATVYFYELHQGDGDLFHDILLAHEDEIDPETFFEMVQEVRRRVQGAFEQDTLIEAIADELEEGDGFVVLRDERLTAAVNVSVGEADNFLADLGEPRSPNDDDDEEDFRSLYATFTPDDRG